MNSFCGDLDAAADGAAAAAKKEAHLISEPRDNKFTQDYARFLSSACLPACHAKV
jgi:hypothetical protein